MKQNVFIVFTIFLIFLICGNSYCAVQSELTSSVSSTTVVQGGELVLNIDFTWIGAPTAYQIEPVKAPDSYLLEIIGSKQENSYQMYNDSKKNTMHFKYVFRASEPGKGRISYCAFEVTERESGIKKIKKTSPYDITVLSKSRYLLRQSTRFATWLIILLIAGSAVFTVGYLTYKSKQKKQEIINKEKSLSGDIEERTLLKLNSVRKYKISGETDKFFDALIKSLQSYFEAKAPGISLKGSRITEEKLNLKSSIPQKQFIEYKEIIAAANRIKFSGEKLTSEELDRWHKRAVKLITFFKDQSRRKLTENQFENINIIPDIRRQVNGNGYD
ncbi:hypothetical protein J7L67_01175 [bacterium]|nr:hypothetical protein [bacterium]